MAKTDAPATVKEGNVVLVRSSVAVYDRAHSSNVITETRAECARQLLTQINELGLITYQREPTNARRQTLQMTAFVGVVDRGYTTKMETRIAERQFEMANELIEEATRYINGNYPDTISKGQIPQALKAVLDTVKARRTKTG